MSAKTNRPARLPGTAEYERAGELRRALQKFVRNTELVTQRNGLTTERYQLLLFIELEARRGAAGATVGQLAEALYLANSTVTQLVRRAEDLGLVRRELSRRDARIRYLRLTEEGERRLAGAVADLGEERAQLAELIAGHAGRPAPPGPPAG
jgi:DNA-binding MarR family transcriptional regulator